ncbi:MAG TPA: sigma-70 family RNA polymerase sigma factor, partial [Gemmataceae bacterium]|nr:sigma-70 family RNA polymerase sigma factor [Gemmataceae bacterium]
MNSDQIRGTLEAVCTTCGAAAVGHFSDEALLDLFIRERHEGAFAALVGRYGPMVQRVCRRRLRDPHSAEDAFQATFLVLAKKAGAIARRHLLANWLYGVATRAAAELAGRAGQRVVAGRPEASADDGDPSIALESEDLYAAVHEELDRLPRSVRAALWLCLVEGCGQEQVARQLGWSLRTLQRRIEQGKGLLKGRLTRRGVEVTAALAALGLAARRSGAAVSGAASARLTAGAVQFAAGTTPPFLQGGAALAVRLLRAASARSLRLAGACLLGAVVLSVTATAAWWRAPSGVPSSPPPAGRADPPEPVAEREPAPAAEAPGDPLPPGALLRLGAARWCKAGPIRCLAVTPDGSQIVGAGVAGEPLQFWDAASGRAGGPPRAIHHGRCIDAVAVTADGRGLVTVSHDEATCRLWDLPGGEERSHFSLGPRLKTSRLSADGGTLVVVDDDGGASAWDVGAGRLLRRIVGRAPFENVVALAAGGATVALYDGRSVHLYDTRAGAPAGKPVPCPRPSALALGLTRTWVDVPWERQLPLYPLAALSADGRALCVEEWGPRDAARPAGEFGNTRFGAALWDVPGGTRRAGLALPGRALTMGFAPDGSRVALTTSRPEAGELSVWDRDGHALGRRPLLPPLPGALTRSLTFFPDGERIVVAGSTGLLSLYDARGAPLPQPPGPRHLLPITRAVLTPDGRRALTQGDDAILSWELATGRATVATLRGRVPDWPWEWQVSPDGRVLARGSASGVRLFDLAANRERLLSPRQGGVFAKVELVAFSADGRRLASVGPAGVVRLWDVATGAELADDGGALAGRRVVELAL